jgi:hypothetical protein
MYYLVLAFTSPEAMKFLYKGITADYPSGLTWKVRASMFKRFKPMDDTSKLEMSQALMMIKTERKPLDFVHSDLHPTEQIRCL